ncbi:AAA family ATPase [Flavitalea sp. BT771]|uniref:AAA family ATPase n=1 Tax=Flavitalea sp. BT771 TaxID=3063329 RepID=UPI0026E47FE5|nr:AAA family ATPase [Flavitalea sp. BT771]MDO6434174.1 AAA family ATPase [Flavitalea sp. BT771]MDV6223074.1 AAA family ATPase [Flavitalea sp. BT771]
MDTIIEQQDRIIDASNIFDRSFLDSKTLFMFCYQQPPCMTWVSQIDMDKVLAYVKKVYAPAAGDIYQYSEWNTKKRRLEVYRTMILLEGSYMIEIAFDYCQVLYTYGDHDKAKQLLREVSRFKRREKKSRFSIDLIMKDIDGIQLKNMDIKRTKLDLGLYYEDDFREVDALIRTRLNKKEDKGIVLLHGLPGAGKTTYLRHLVGTLRKKVLFLSPSAADHIMNPDFMDLLIDNPDCVLVIEDAENIIMDRKVNGTSSVSNLLNISDGLLADALRIQIICTFNQSLSLVDGALMRKGRLIAQYEFGKLSVEKSQRLSEHLGFKGRIHRPMTIAEIAHQGEKDQGELQRVQVVGFRRHAYAKDGEQLVE